MPVIRPQLLGTDMHVRLYDITAITLISNLHGMFYGSEVMKIYPGSDNLYSSLSIDLLNNVGKSIFKVWSYK